MAWLADLAASVTLTCWPIYLLIFVRPKSKRSVVTRDRSSLFGVALQLAGASILWFLRSPDAVVISLAPVAIVLAPLSIWISRAALREIGPQWGLLAEIRLGHALVTTGIYGVVRHPLHLGFLLLLLATGVSVSGLPALAASVGVSLAGIAIRTRTEERLLQETFGPAFDEYRRHVPALIPRAPWI